MITTATKAHHEALTNEEYHARPEIGASMINTFRNSRRKFFRRYVEKSIPGIKPTEAMDFGTVVHCLLFEPENIDTVLAPMAPSVAPDGKKWLRRKGSDHEMWWEEYEESCNGLISLTAKRIEDAKLVVDSIHNTPRAARMLERDGQSEHSIFWTDNETGLELKCRVDWFLQPVSFDLKTSRDPTPAEFSKQVANLGYYLSRAHYHDGIAALTGENPMMIHVAAESAAPFRVCMYDLNDVDRDGNSLGRIQLRTALRQIAECFESGDWSDPWEHDVIELRLPGWAFTNDMYSFF